MKVYAPFISKTFIKIDNKLVNIKESFDIAKNITEIKKKFDQPDGGKSGSFFYFTWDKKLLFKTMTTEEKDEYLSKLYNYCLYLSENKNSLISKIYGVYSFQKDSTKDQKHLLVMRNISPCESKYILRRFDLKGSTVNRSTEGG